jgi:predicted adenylyl cyclase CyaB
MKRMVITGGPGVGKSTTLEILAQQGYTVIPEAAREVIRKEQLKGFLHQKYSPAVPWNDLSTFQRMVTELQHQQEEGRDEPVIFLDRGKMDALAYARLDDVSLESATLEKMLDTEYDTIFVLEPLSTYKNDAQRKEDKIKAEQIHRAIVEEYMRLGFHVVSVPAMKKKQRAEYILQHCEQSSREIECKYKVEGHDQIRTRLEKEGFIQKHCGDEHNSFYDLGGLLKKTGWSIRLRSNGEYTLTIKGPSRSKEISDKFEKNIHLTLTAYKRLQTLLSPFEFHSYTKQRESYRPFGDAKTEICLDTLEGIGTFVEIESRSIERIRYWKQRLGITGEVEKSSYLKFTKK